MPRTRRKKLEPSEVDKLFQFDEAMEDPVEAAPTVTDAVMEEEPAAPENAEPAEAPPDEEPSVAAVEPENSVSNAEEPEPDEEVKEEEEPVDEVAPDLSQLDATKAQDELTNLDILVCGRCHSVFHFTEELLLHKKTDCSGVSEVLTNNFKPDSKPPVWAFVLYKVYKMKQKSDDWNKSSWQLYQKWSDLKDSVKQTWVEAAKGLQQIATFMPSTPITGKTIGNSKRALVGAEREKTLLDLQKELEDDNETEMMSSLGLQREKSKTGQNVREVNQIWRKPLVKKDGDDDDEVLYTAEKIVAKRVNPKTKQAEYLVKWQGYPTDLNTWEQVGNMDSCIKLVQEFEKNLAKQKARKAAEAKEKSQLTYSETTQFTPGGRPLRHSALKALDQVKEWVGGGVKRSVEEEDEDDDEGRKSEYQMVPRKKFQKNPVMVANAKGMHRVDARSVPNLSSGVYIISTQSGLIKVDDTTANKLASCVNSEDRKKIAGDSRFTMINETEVRKIPGSQLTSKVNILRKESPVVRKESPVVNILQKPRSNVARTPPLRTIGSQRQIIIGGQKMRPLPGPIVSPLRLPAAKQRVGIKSVPTQRRSGATIIRTVSSPQAIIRKEKVGKQQEEEYVTGIGDDYNKDDETIAGGGSLCPLTGELIGQSDDKTGDNSMADVDDDGMMHVAVSPGGSYHQVVPPTSRKSEKKQARSLLAQRRTIEVQQELQPADQGLISIEGEDGEIYQITPEQQQMLLQNGTITMDSSQDENREIILGNGQIMERRMSADDGDEEQTVLLNPEQAGKEEMGGEMYTEDGMLTLDSAVQEAVSQAAAEQSDSKPTEQMVAQIIHADPPTPGGGPRKVVLLLPDGQMIQTDMEEAQYQSLEFEK